MRDPLVAASGCVCSLCLVPLTVCQEDLVDPKKVEIEFEV